MWIRRLRAHFGALDGEFAFEQDRLNLVLDRNERGKSTLIAAIVAALYGFPARTGRRRSGLLHEKDRFRPRFGSRYEVHLDVVADEGEFRIFRDFDKDLVVVREGLTGADVTDKFRSGKNQYDVGLRLLGLTEEQFTKSALVRQDEIQQVKDTTDLTQKLEAAISTGEGDRTSAEAIAALTDALDHFEGSTLKTRGKVETELSRLQSQIDDVERKMQALDSERSRLDEELQDLPQLDRSIADHTRNREETRYLRLLAERQEMQARLQKHSDASTLVQENRELADALQSHVRLERSDYDRATELVARLDASVAEVSQAEILATKSEEALKQTREALAPYENFDALTGQDLNDALRTQQSLLDAADRMQKQDQELRDLEAEVIATGVDLSALDDLNARFRRLNTEGREFIQSYAQRRLDHERAITELTRELLSGETPQGGAGKLWIWLAGAVVTGLIGLGLLLIAPLLGLVVIVIALGVAALAWFMPQAVRLNGDTQQDAMLHMARQEIEAAEDALADHEDKGRKLALSLDFADADDLVSAYSRYVDARAESSRLEEKRKATADARAQLESRRDQAAEFLRRAETDVLPDRVTGVLFEQFTAQLGEALDLRKRRQTEELLAKAHWEDVQRRQASLAAIRQDIAGIATHYGLSADEPGVLLSELGRMLENREQLDRIEQERLPALVRDLLDDAEVYRLSVAAESTASQVSAMLRLFPEFATLMPEAEAAEYSRLEQEHSDALEELHQKRSVLLQRTAAALDRYQSEYPGCLYDRGKLRSSLARVSAFRTSVELARSTLQVISAESHHDWAQALNRTSLRLVPILNNHFRQMRFDTNLHFVVTDSDGYDWDQVQVDSQLSAGARDQLYLALRLALAESFFGNGSAPIILDDPFVSFDDERFRTALAFLVEQVSPKHQVILTSCHELRHRALLEGADAFADRIHFVDLEASRAG